MLYRMFIYQIKSGLLLWEKSFDRDIDLKSELFSSFFSAIQSFLREMILQGTQDQDKKSLAGIDMGNFVVKIFKIKDVDAELVILADKADEKSLKKFGTKVLNILKHRKELFKDWDGDRSRFSVLDLEILQIMSNFKNLSGNKSIIDNKNEFLNEIMKNLPELKDDQKTQYNNELTFLDERLKQSTNIFKKLEIVNSMEVVLHKLKNKEKIKELQEKRRKLMAELNSTKEKMAYFLSKAKASLSKTVETGHGKSLFELNYQTAYTNLYSFSTKLKNIGNTKLYDYYRSIAKIFIDKPEEKKSEFPNIVREVLNLSDNIDDYLIRE
ncbi:hypothetical protein WKT22_01492 [Candidatus Lokiarchaeum ossiferum]